MLPVVWGTKVREEMGGACAHLCPGCGEVTIADEFIVSVAEHIYFIRGSYNEAQRYVCCRLCGMAVELSPATSPIPSANQEGFLPSEEFIAVTNPGLAGNPAPEEHEVELPRGVSRVHWAVLTTINNAFARQNKDDKVTGFTGGLAVIAMFGMLFLAVRVWNWSRENGGLTAAIVACAAFVIFGAIYVLHTFLVHRAVRKQVHSYVVNCLCHTRIKVRDLADAAKKLGKDFDKAGRHVARCARSYDTWSRYAPKRTEPVGVAKRSG